MSKDNILEVPPSVIEAHAAMQAAQTLRSANVILLKDEPSDAEFAESLKARLRDALEGVVKLCDEAASRGLALQFSVVLLPNIPKYTVQNVAVVKHY